MNPRDLSDYEGLSAFLPGAVFRYRVGVDGEGRLEHMTQACFEIWELDRTAVEHDMASLWAMVEPADLPEMRRSVEDCARDLRDWDCQWRITTRSGRRKWLHGMGRPIRESDGSLLWHVLVMDQTDNRAAQEAQRASEQRFRRLIEAIPNVAVQGYDSQLVCRFWNAASERLYGYTQEEALGRSLLDLIIPDGMREGVVAATADMLRTGEAIPSGELTLRHQDGSDVHVYSGHVLLDHAGGHPEFFCIDFDLSERMAAEDARHALEVQLREAQKMEALGTLAGGIAHDFNNILAAVLGNASLALEEAPPQGELRESVEQIQKAARRARAVVRQILAFARKELPRKTAIDLLPVVQEACSLLKTTAPPGVRVDMASDADLPVVLADATQMEQVLLNLGTNAIHAVTDQFDGRVQVVLTAALREAFEALPGHAVLQSSAPGHRQGVWLRVQDNGRGMSPDTAQRIFEPFFTTKERGQGTGLGLSVVHGILKEHGAGLKLHSVEGVGTMFDLWLESATPVAAEVPAVSAMTASSTGPVRHLLYVDDDDQINDMVVRTCAREGHRAHALSDPYQALEYVRTHGPAIDLAVFDHNMPTMAGAQLVAKVLQICPGLACAVVSAVVDEQLKQHALGKGALFVAEKTEAMVPALLEGLQRHRPRA